MSRIYEALQKDERDNTWKVTDIERTLPEKVPGPPRPSLLPPMPQRDFSEGKIDWTLVTEAFRKYWRSAVAFASVVVLTALAVTILTKPVYEPAARVEIDPPGAELFSLEGRGGSDDSADYMETQARNMRSDQLLISVIRQLHLDQVPEFIQPSFASRAFSVAFSGIQRLPSLLWSRKESEQTAGSASSKALSPSEASALGTFQSQLSIKRDTASRLVTVSFASHDPTVAANVTNTVIRSFIDHTYETRHAAIMESTEWLSKQLDDIRAKMQESNRALAGFQSSSGIADIDQNRNTFSERMAELTRQKTEAQAERIQIDSYLRRVRNSDVSSLPQIQSNQVVQLLKQRLGETQAELAQTLVVYGNNHPNTRKLQNQKQELESQIKLQNAAIVSQMETSYGASLAREQLIDDQLRGTARELAQMSRYTVLKKEAEANTELYNALYARVKEAGISAASKSINVRIVDEARILDSPTRPRPLINLGFGLAVGLGGGVLLIFVRQTLDTRIHTIEDVRRVIGSSAVSMVPIAEGNGRSSALGSLTTVFGSASKARPQDGPTNFLLEEPASEQSEAFRGLNTSVMLCRPGYPPRVLLVASSLPGEGKTTVAINLAVTLSQQGRTCILDTDLRRPSVAKALRTSTTFGLSEYLVDSIPLESVLIPVPTVHELTVLAAGKSVADPATLINSKNMRMLIGQLRGLYDFIVIDSPPILAYAEGRALAPFVDGVVFVGRAGIVTREAMSRSMDLLQQVHSAPVLEVVLNGTSSRCDSYGYKYYYSHGS